MVSDLLLGCRKLASEISACGRLRQTVQPRTRNRLPPFSFFPTRWFVRSLLAAGPPQMRGGFRSKLTTWSTFPQTHLNRQTQPMAAPSSPLYALGLCRPTALLIFQSLDCRTLNGWRGLRVCVSGDGFWFIRAHLNAALPVQITWIVSRVMCPGHQPSGDPELEMNLITDPARLAHNPARK